jgi:hypothetical protein
LPDRLSCIVLYCIVYYIEPLSVAVPAPPLLLPWCPRGDDLAPVMSTWPASHPPPLAIFKLLNWIIGGRMKTAHVMWSLTQHLSTLLYTGSILINIVCEWWVNKQYLLTYLLWSMTVRCGQKFCAVTHGAESRIRIPGQIFKDDGFSALLLSDLNYHFYCHCFSWFCGRGCLLLGLNVTMCTLTVPIGPFMYIYIWSSHALPRGTYSGIIRGGTYNIPHPPFPSSLPQFSPSVGRPRFFIMPV